MVNRMRKKKPHEEEEEMGTDFSLPSNFFTFKASNEDSSVDKGESCRRIH